MASGRRSVTQSGIQHVSNCSPEVVSAGDTININIILLEILFENFRIEHLKKNRSRGKKKAGNGQTAVTIIFSAGKKCQIQDRGLAYFRSEILRFRSQADFFSKSQQTTQPVKTALAGAAIRSTV